MHWEGRRVQRFPMRFSSIIYVLTIDGDGTA